MPLRLSIALAALAAACALPAASAAATAPARTTRAACGYSGYSYAGYQSPAKAFGISGRLTVLSAPGVQSGHVAAWLGVGGAGMGPGASDEWVQVGIAGFPDGHSELYYEYLTPAMPSPRYVTIATASVGVAHDVAVQERDSTPGAWRVLVDGKRVSPPIVLPGSDGAWQPLATSESWDGGQRVCNAFAYDFSSLAVATKRGGGWQPLALTRPIQDPGYAVRARLSAFTAAVAR